MDNHETERRKAVRWLLYWSLIPAFFNGLLAWIAIAAFFNGTPEPIVFLFGFASYFIQFPTSLIWLTGVLAIFAYYLSKHFGFKFPKVVKQRASSKKLLILWIIVPLLAYTIPYCVIMGQALVRATPYDPFRWDYAIFGYFIYLFLLATVAIPYGSYGFYIIIVLFTLWVMGIAKLYNIIYHNEKEQSAGGLKDNSLDTHLSEVPNQSNQ